jgi:hypothetical protein
MWSASSSSTSTATLLSPFDYGRYFTAESAVAQPPAWSVGSARQRAQKLHELFNNEGLAMAKRLATAEEEFATDQERMEPLQSEVSEISNHIAALRYFFSSFFSSFSVPFIVLHRWYANSVLCSGQW